MTNPASWARRVYGAGAVHFVLMVVAFTCIGYIIYLLGITTLWDTHTWWQSIIVWFAGAVIVHELVLFPLYTFGDRVCIQELLGRHLRHSVNYLRVPSCAAALTFLVFFPGILQFDAGTYRAATGQTQDLFLIRWLILTAGFYAASAIVYVVRRTYRARRKQCARHTSGSSAAGGQ